MRAGREDGGGAGFSAAAWALFATRKFSYRRTTSPVGPSASARPPRSQRARWQKAET